MVAKLIMLFVIAFIQNMSFTLISRSRNSGDPKRHLWAAMGGNGLWFICSYFILFPEILKVVNDGDVLMKLVFMVVYVTATSLGSVVMMKMNLGHINIPFLTKIFIEKQKGKVGER